MPKFNRNGRIAIITKYLIENPSTIVNLNKFMDMFSAAKSTVSEDVVVIRQVFEDLRIGKVETVSGASGGIKFINNVSEEEILDFSNQLCGILNDNNRLVPGGFIYVSDILFNPKIVYKAAIILASLFSKLNVDCVVTVETKGIPLAYEVAKMLGINLVIVRRDSKVTEGPTVSINYVSGSSNRIQTMSLSKKSIKKGSRCIFIDDFMRAGGTAIGIINLLKEFESELVGIGILIDNMNTDKKLVNDYVSIVEYKGIDEELNPVVTPSTIRDL